MSATAETQAWTEIRPSRGFLRRLGPGELWRFRELLYFLALRDLQLRYKQTLFGIGWVVLAPLVGVAVFTALLGGVHGLPRDGVPYAVLVLSGLVVWRAFATGVERAAQQLVESPELVTKVYFPRLLVPLAAVLPALVDLAVLLVVVGVFLMIYGITPGLPLALLPVWILALVTLAFAVGTWLSAITVQYRDLRHVLSFLLQFWFFASPVVFASSIVDSGKRWLFALNPLVGLIDSFRWSLAGAPPPPTADLISLLVGALLLVSGVIYFQRVERRFADVI
jgi:lipopolysaccharide transport system permease protein